MQICVGGSERGNPANTMGTSPTNEIGKAAKGEFTSMPTPLSTVTQAVLGSILSMTWKEQLLGQKLFDLLL
jgi:hypothetical protein